jgi:hypothetical protein
MSKLMWIAGILLTAAGAALGLMCVVSAASVVGYGVGLDLAAILLVGGILSLGLGSVISLLDQQRALLAGRADLAAPPAAAIPEYGRKAAEAAVAASAMRDSTELSEPTRDTIEALEQARQKIEQAFDPPSAPPDAEEPEAEAASGRDTAEDVASDEAQAVPGQLYVVEERIIRDRPARILSDGTVEAETTEGWMRFENLEHLDEYLDAVEATQS